MSTVRAEGPQWRGRGAPISLLGHGGVSDGEEQHYGFSGAVLGIDRGEPSKEPTFVELVVTALPIGVAFGWHVRKSSLCIAKLTLVPAQSPEGLLVNGAVEASGKVRVGDFLVAINGQSLLIESQEAALKLMRATPLPWTLRFVPGATAASRKKVKRKKKKRKKRRKERPRSTPDGPIPKLLGVHTAAVEAVAGSTGDARTSPETTSPPIAIPGGTYTADPADNAPQTTGPPSSKADKRRSMSGMRRLSGVSRSSDVSKSSGVSKNSGKSGAKAKRKKHGTSRRPSSQRSKTRARSRRSGRIKSRKKGTKIPTVVKKKTKNASVPTAVAPDDPRDIAVRVRRRLTQALAPVELLVENMSYWYLNRSNLGARKFLSRGLKARETTSEWDAHIHTNYVHQKTQQLMSQQQLVGTYATKEQAKQGADDAAHDRDFGPCATTTCETRLQTHFRITVVSPLFKRMPLLDRYCLVYDILCDLLWDPQRASTTHGPGASRWRKYGTCRKHVCDLPPYRYFLSLFTLQLKSPAERRPPAVKEATMEQRYGASHVETMQPDAAAVAKDSDLIDLLTVHGVTGSNAGSSAGHASVAGGGSQTHSHQALLQQLHDAMSVSTDTSRSMAARSHTWASRAGTKDPQKLRSHFIECQLQFMKAALSFQRIYRCHLSRTMHRLWIRRHAAAICLSRIYRGYVGRVFEDEYKDVRTGAATTIEAARRGMLGRRAMRKHRAELDRALRHIQPLMRGYLLRKWFRMEQSHRWAAVCIQRLVRGHWARSMRQRLEAVHLFRIVIVPAVLTLQCALRSCLARMRTEGYARQCFHISRIVPACQTLQRYCRGYFHRCRAAARRRRAKAAGDIQRAWHGRLARRVYNSILHVQKRQRMALVVQSHVRRYLGQSLRHEMQDRYHFFEVLHPSARLAQRIYRGFRAKRLVQRMKTQNAAARSMQRFWRGVMARGQAKLHLIDAAKQIQSDAATLLQAHVRRYLAAWHVTIFRRVVLAKQIKATMKMQAAWRIYSARKSVLELRAKMRSLWSQKMVRECTEDGDEILEEINELQGNRKFSVRVKRRVARQISGLRQTLHDMRQRIPDVEREIEALDSDDERHGWMEMMEWEWETTKQRCLMCQEELGAKKIQISDLATAIDDYTLEIEELEFDLDECETQRLRVRNKVHLREIADIEVQVEREWAKRVRNQKQRWGVRNQDLRRNVVLRAYGKKNPPPQPRKSPAILLASMSHKDNQQRQKVLSQWQAEMKMRNQSLKWQAKQTAGTGNPEWQDTYNRATTNIYGLMQLVSYTHAFKQKELDVKRMTSICLKCGKANCSCNFIPEEERLF